MLKHGMQTCSKGMLVGGAENSAHALRQGLREINREKQMREPPANASVCWAFQDKMSNVFNARGGMLANTAVTQVAPHPPKSPKLHFQLVCPNTQTNKGLPQREGEGGVQMWGHHSGAHAYPL